jgi:hypothetical protein
MGVGGQHHAPAALPPGKTRYPLYIPIYSPYISVCSLKMAIRSSRNMCKLRRNAVCSGFQSFVNDRVEILARPAVVWLNVHCTDFSSATLSGCRSDVRLPTVLGHLYSILEQFRRWCRLNSSSPNVSCNKS